jgi:protein-S-isoprenylcysteine O-methyltransferase Ste14
LARVALGRLVGGLVVIAGILFLSAGTFRYWQAWLFLAVLFIPISGALVYLLARAPDVLERRLRTREKEQAQGPILAVASLSLLAALIVPGLDRRFGWSDVPVWVVLAACGVILLGYGLFLLVLRENRYAARTIAVEQAQTVIDTSPYAVVRHPMYVAALLIYGAMPLALGSYWGLLPVLGAALGLVARILNEETVLTRDLPGYPAYLRKVRYRLIPGIW